MGETGVTLYAVWTQNTYTVKVAQLIRLVALRGSFGHAGDISSARGILLVEYLALDSPCS